MSDPVEWTPRRELPCLLDCSCDREMLHSAAEGLVGARIFSNVEADEVLALGIWHFRMMDGRARTSCFDFRTVNRLVDVDCAFQLLHFFLHLSDVAFEKIVRRRIPPGTLNQALLQQVSTLLSASGRPGKLFRIHASSLHIVAGGPGNDEAEQIATLQKFVRSRKLCIFMLQDQQHVQRVLALITGRGTFPLPGEISEMEIVVSKSLFSGFIDILVEVGLSFCTPNNCTPVYHFSSCPPSNPVSTRASR